jgi:hypothetical protein
MAFWMEIARSWIAYFFKSEFKKSFLLTSTTVYPKVILKKAQGHYCLSW